MKGTSYARLFYFFLVSGIFLSCDKEDKPEEKSVTGNFVYVTTNFVPIEVDPVTQIPMSANISMTGTGDVTELGNMAFATTFKFDFVTGKGTDFVTTYTGVNPSDSYNSTGTSQRQSDGSITITESFSNGKGRFANIKGGGETIVNINADQSGGTGSVSWKVTY